MAMLPKILKIQKSVLHPLEVTRMVEMMITIAVAVAGTMATAMTVHIGNFF